MRQSQPYARLYYYVLKNTVDTLYFFQNFYLIDPHLVAFIVTIIFRKLLLSITLAVLRAILAPKLMLHATIAARFEYNLFILISLGI